MIPIWVSFSLTSDDPAYAYPTWSKRMMFPTVPAVGTMIMSGNIVLEVAQVWYVECDDYFMLRCDEVESPSRDTFLELGWALGDCFEIVGDLEDMGVDWRRINSDTNIAKLIEEWEPEAE